MSEIGAREGLNERNGRAWFGLFGRDGECEEVSVEELEREDEHALHEARIAMMAQWEKSVRTMHVRNAEIIAIAKAVEAGKNAVGEEEKAMTHKEQVLAMQRMEERTVERHIHEM